MPARVGRKTNGSHRSDAVQRLLRCPVADSEVHIGDDPLGRLVTRKGGQPARIYLHSRLEVYEQQIEPLNIRHALLIPTPTYELKLASGEVERSCLWSMGGGITYKKITMTNLAVSEEVNPRQPYINMNRYLLGRARSENARLGESIFHFVPLFHPKLDNKANIEEFLNDPLTVAVKVHGIATHTSPADMPAWAPKLLSRYDKPFFFHTDYQKSTYTRSRAEGDIASANSAIKWAGWVAKNGTRAYLAHGARLDLGVASMMEKSGKEDLVVGVGPDLLLNHERERLAKDVNYLTALLDMFPSKRVLFSSDFAWNITPNSEEVCDWDSKRRVVEGAIGLGIEEKEIEGILMGNAVRFFKL